MTKNYALVDEKFQGRKTKKMVTETIEPKKGNMRIWLV